MNASPAVAASTGPAAQPATIPASLALDIEFGVHNDEFGGTPLCIVPAIQGRPAYVLIAATGPDGEIRAAWGAYGASEPGAQCEWDGQANTRALVASQHDHPAAEQVAALRIGGFHDWYLMAKRESAFAYAAAPAGLFYPGWHWTSTQFSAYDAWDQCFDVGSQYGSGKLSEGRVRAVRRLVIQ